MNEVNDELIELMKTFLEGNDLIKDLPKEFTKKDLQTLSEIMGNTLFRIFKSEVEYYSELK